MSLYKWLFTVVFVFNYVILPNLQGQDKVFFHLGTILFQAPACRLHDTSFGHAGLKHLSMALGSQQKLVELQKKKLYK